MRAGLKGLVDHGVEPRNEVGDLGESAEIVRSGTSVQSEAERLYIITKK